MKNNQALILYLIIFIIFSTFAKFFGFAYFDSSELLFVVLIAYGAGTVFSSMGNNQRISLFLGSAAFLVGILFFIKDNFTIFSSHSMVVPASILIIGFSLLIVFFDDTNEKIIFWISLLFILAGIVHVSIFGNIRLVPFVYSLYDILLKYWFVVLVAVVAIYIVVINNKNNE
jgi:hypothetical protein